MSVVEQKGTTLHLLKHSSKPVSQARKRRKLNIYGEPPVEDKPIDLKAMREEVKGADSFDQITPNIINIIAERL